MQKLGQVCLPVEAIVIYLNPFGTISPPKHLVLGSIRRAFGELSLQ